MKKNGLNSYWEMRNAYFLEELADAPPDLTVSLFFTGTGAANENYAGLLDDFIVDPYFGALLFNFRDATGFYPRPFPGEYPYPEDPPPSRTSPSRRTTRSTAAWAIRRNPIRSIRCCSVTR